MTMKEFEQWRKDNPDWDRDWSRRLCFIPRNVQMDRRSKSSGWNEVLDRASKQPGSVVRKNEIINSNANKEKEERRFRQWNR